MRGVFFYLSTKISILVNAQIPPKSSACVSVLKHKEYICLDPTETHCTNNM